MFSQELGENTSLVKYEGTTRYKNETSVQLNFFIFKNEFWLHIFSNKRALYG
jgi:hypothetical protein